MSQSKRLVGLLLAVVITSGGPAFAETSLRDHCGWARPALLDRITRPKFSLHVALRAFSFAKAPTNTSVRAAAFQIATEDMDAERREEPRENILQEGRKGIPQLFSWMGKWRLEKDRGLFRPLRPGSRIAFSYSDIFETGGDPDKGGHGLGILFRRDLGPRSKRSTN